MSNRIVLIVKSNVYNALYPKIVKFGKYLQADGYNVLMYQSVDDTAVQIKQYLKILYNEIDSLQSAIFIGNIPYVMY